MDISQLTFTHLKNNIQIKKQDAIAGTKIAILADTASQLVVQTIEGYGLEYNVQYDIFEAGFDEIDRQVFDLSSGLYRHSPDFVIILRSSEKLLEAFYALDTDQRRSFAVGQFDYMVSLCKALQGQTKARIIFSNLPEMDDNIFGNYASNTDKSFLYQIRKLNLHLMEWAQVQTDLYICDLCYMVARKGHEYSIDTRFYIHANVILSLDFLPLLAKSIHDMIQSLLGRSRKCIILDLDNILWGGVIGDDGIENIRIGQLGIGKIFSHIQRWVQELSRRGIIVAICSKNSAETAKIPFLSHPEMVLRLSDIAVFLANWENKTDNIRRIREILNIGFDSMVFIDDNPFEREMVKRTIPGIAVPELPEDPALYLSYLQGLNLFEAPYITEQDSNRTRQYQNEVKRTQSQKEFFDEDEFLKSLQMNSTVRAFDEFSIPRIAQLAQRTNQFNLRTIRYTESSLSAIARDADYLTLSFTLKDIYGDHGLIAAIILHKEGKDTLFIENWMMSCRVFKRGMEAFAICQMEEIAKNAGYNKLEGEYIPTEKNTLVKDHYQKFGFLSVAGGRWRLDLDKSHDELLHYISESNNLYYGKAGNYTDAK